MKALYLFSVWLHILAAMVWIGGMVFLVVVLVPFIRQPAYRSIAAPLIRWAGLRFRLVGWLCFGILLLSGIFNLAYRGISWGLLGTAQFWQSFFGHILALKLFLVVLIFLISALHDFLIGPKAGALMQGNPMAPETQRLRRQAGLLGRINLLLALIVVALGVMLVRGWFW